MNMSVQWSDIRPLMPWIITSVSVAYVAYIHYQLRQQSNKSLSPKINPNIDKHKDKVKHVYKGHQLDKDDNQEFLSVSSIKTIDKINDISDSEDRPRGRRSAYSYFVTDCADRETNRLCHLAEDRLVFAEFAKKCAKNWKKLSYEEKQYYHRLSEEDKLRYESEIKKYGKQKPKSKSRQSKRICSQMVCEVFSNDKLLDMAFDMFANEELSALKEKSLLNSNEEEEVMSELLNRWNQSEPEFKNQYIERIQLDAKAFNQSFNTSIRDEDEDIVNECENNNCGSDRDFDSNDWNHSKSSKV
ncbi:high mobility group protein 1 homolog [Oppia nitens]|uniref:high mobility group protein 1 homolog n=1 Tax=Oppia nitens TaxID=1686743 RepID=UPI0023DCAC35|nr:high mobility group protein 1 homolog [Oppia nitens]